MKKSIVINSFKRVTAKNGKQWILINAGTPQEQFITAGQFNNANSGNISDLSLNGCTVNLTFYKEGEELLNKDICSEGGKLIRDVSITPSMEAKISADIAAKVAASFGFTMNTSAPKAKSAPVAKETEETEETPEVTSEGQDLTAL
jgi:hypothetical protein